MRVLVRYHEIALKGNNRPFFVAKLVGNLKRATADLPGIDVKSYAGRVSLDAPDAVDWPTLDTRLRSIFGIANYSRVFETEKDVERLKTEAVGSLKGRSFSSFRITTRRSDKQFPKRSAEIDRELGAAVALATGARVDLKHPELTLFVEVLHDKILYSFERLPGPGGIPVGSSGKVLALLSGGIDSPVAAWRMMKRGCNVLLVNFHAYPLQDHTMIDKVRELSATLARYQYRSRLYLVPFAPLQQQIVADCPAPLRVVLYRRFMLRIASALARRLGAKALVTGESLGQVASQTLDNLATIDDAASLPVLRPLVGMDKGEITDQARAIGTFDTSTLPDQDCCQLFVPRSPSVAASIEEARRAEEALDVAAFVATAVKAAEQERCDFPKL